jgi:hypothetical protein
MLGAGRTEVPFWGAPGEDLPGDLADGLLGSPSTAQRLADAVRVVDGGGTTRAIRGGCCGGDHIFGVEPRRWVARAARSANDDVRGRADCRLRASELIEKEI